MEEVDGTCEDEACFGKGRMGPVEGAFKDERP